MEPHTNPPHNPHNTHTTQTPKPGRNRRKKLKHRLFKAQLESQAITNLSDHTLTQEETELLTKGLSFIPTHNTQTTDIATYTDEFIKTLHTDHYFKDKPRSTPLFHTKSNWVPPTPTNQQLKTLTDTIRNASQLAQLGGPALHPEPIPEHQQAIQSLINNKNITTKRADKGGSVVIMNTKDYINTALTHLQQADVYTEHKEDGTIGIFDQLNSYLLQLEHTGKLNHRIIKYIQPKQPPRTPLFYFLPKIHKPNNPPRPIISGCDSPTDRLSNYISQILNPIAQAQPSYIKDTKHLLQIIGDTDSLAENTFLVTADVTSLYTNIPHEEGIATALKALTDHKHLLPPHTPKMGSYTTSYTSSLQETTLISSRNTTYKSKAQQWARKWRLPTQTSSWQTLNKTSHIHTFTTSSYGNDISMIYSSYGKVQRHLYWTSYKKPTPTTTPFSSPLNIHAQRPNFLTQEHT